MRLESSKLAMLWLPLSVIGYAWVSEKHVNVAVICIMLVLIGFTSMYVDQSFVVVVALTSTSRWMYSSTLAYIVDANPGRSCTAVATNSSFRGSLAFVSVMTAVPLQVRFLDLLYSSRADASILSVQDTLGDGGLYTAWAGVLIVMELSVLLVLRKGESWRRESEKRECEVLSA
jgi:hypothetical protein